MDQRLAGDIAWSKSMARRVFPTERRGGPQDGLHFHIVKLVSVNTWRIMHTNARSLRLKFPSLLLHKGYDISSFLLFSFLFCSLTRSCWRNKLWPRRLFYGGKHYLNFSMIVDEKYVWVKKKKKLVFGFIIVVTHFWVPT